MSLTSKGKVHGFDLDGGRRLMLSELRESISAQFQTFSRGEAVPLQTIHHQNNQHQHNK